MHRRLDAHEGEVVGDVVALGVLTAGNEVLEEAVPGEPLGGILVADLVEVVELDPDAVEQLLSGFPRDLPGVEVGLIVRIDVLVEPSGRDRMPGGFRLEEHLYEPEGLARLVEGGRGLFGHPRADLRNARELGTPRRVGLPPGQLAREDGIAPAVFARGLAAENDRLKEADAGGVVGVAEAAFRELSRRAVADAREADLQNLLVFDGEVPDAVVEVVAGGENVVLHGGERLGGHVGGGQLAGRPALPVGQDLPQPPLGLVGDVKGVGGAFFHRVELLFKPFPRVLGEDLAAARGDAVAPDDQLLRPDGDRQLPADFEERLGAPEDDRFPLRFAVALGQQDRPVRLDHRHLRVQVADQPVDARAFFDVFVIESSHNPHAVLSVGSPIVCRCADASSGAFFQFTFYQKPHVNAIFGGDLDQRHGVFALGDQK